MALVTQKAGAPCDLNTLFQLSGQPDHSEKRVSDQAEAEHVTWSLVKGQAQCEEQQDVVSDEDRVPVSSTSLPTPPAADNVQVMSWL